MKYLVVSDIHGSLYYGKLAISMYEKHQCDSIIILGDILYHGPRNDLPRDYNPKELFAFLNKYKDKIKAVRGNCDAQIDKDVLEFEIKDDYLVNEINHQEVYFTHGDFYNSKNLPKQNIYLFHGHTHVQRYVVNSDHVYINPGSIAIPKEDSYHGFIIINEDKIEFYDEFDNLRDTKLITKIA